MSFGRRLRGRKMYRTTQTCHNRMRSCHKGCCDYPELCGSQDPIQLSAGTTAAEFSCPPEPTDPAEKYKPSTEECRAKCPDCEYDEAEFCPGDSYDCGPNIVLNTELCILRGQTMDSGVVTVTVQSDGVMTFLMDFNMGLATDGDGKNIKIFVGTTPPGNAAGKYPYHSGVGGGVEVVDAAKHIYKLTLNVATLEGAPSLAAYGTCPDSPTKIYFALHFDMSDGETAWFLKCDNSVVEESSFPQSKRWGGYLAWDGLLHPRERTRHVQ